MLDTEEGRDRTALSYIFRPLTKNKYVSKDKNGCVSILARGRALFPELAPLISVGGKESDRRRAMIVSRMAALMEHSGIPAVADRQGCDAPYFIPSACWRKLAPGILSTTRFTGILIAGRHRLAVYDIGDGAMEWQARAEGSLFYTKYGSYETKATGMLFVCRKSAREGAAQNIIRQTMWYRRTLLKENCLERDRPVRWSNAPVRLKAQYEHVYLTTPDSLIVSLRRILDEEEYVQILCADNNGTLSGSQGIGDVEVPPRRLFVNPACDLLKFVRFFAAAKTYLEPKQEENFYQPQITLELYIYPEDQSIAWMYPNMQEWEGLSVYVYQPKQNAGSNQ